MEISIISTLTDNNHGLQLTIESVLAQTKQNWEWIISVPEKSKEVISYLQNLNDDRVVVNILPNCISKVSQYNSSLSFANNRYICFIESGDFWDEDFLLQMHHYLKNNSSEIVYCGYDIINSKNNEKIKTIIAKGKISYKQSFNRSPLAIFCLMYDSRFLGKVYLKQGLCNYKLILWIELLKKTQYCFPLNMVLAKTNNQNLDLNLCKKLYFKYKLFRDYKNYSILKAFHYAFMCIVMSKCVIKTH